MRAIIYETGGVEALAIQEVEDPRLEPGEVLLRVKACAMNHLDVWATKDPNARRFDGLRIMGSDVAGTVEALGPGVSGYSPGDRVLVAPGLSCGHCTQCQRGQHSDCAEYKLLGVHRDGGYSELMRIPAVNLSPLPDEVSFEDGSSIPLVFITVWRMLVERANVQPGEWVLVNSAGSGVGIAAIQVARLFRRPDHRHRQYGGEADEGPRPRCRWRGGLHQARMGRRGSASGRRTRGGRRHRQRGRQHTG